MSDWELLLIIVERCEVVAMALCCFGNGGRTLAIEPIIDEASEQQARQDKTTVKLLLLGTAPRLRLGRTLSLAFYIAFYSI